MSTASADRWPLVIVHGALGSASQMEPLRSAISSIDASQDVLLLELEGHGATPADNDWSMPRFADNLASFIGATLRQRAIVFGYSMGGYISLLLASRSLPSVVGVMTYGTKFYWDEKTASMGAARLDPKTLREKVPAFANALEARHARAGGWEQMLRRTARLLHSLGSDAPLTTERLAAITCPVRVTVGDQDNTVTVEETTEWSRKIPGSTLEVFSGMLHPIEQVEVNRLARSIVDFAARCSAA